MVRLMHSLHAVFPVEEIVFVRMAEGGVGAERDDGVVGGEVERGEAGVRAGTQAEETFEVEDVEEGGGVAEGGFDVDVAVDEGDEEDLEVGCGGVEGEEEGEDVVDAVRGPVSWGWKVCEIGGGGTLGRCR